MSTEDSGPAGVREAAAKVAIAHTGPAAPLLTENDHLFSKPPAFIFGYAYAAGQTAQAEDIYKRILSMPLPAARTLSEQEIREICRRYWHSARDDAFKDLPALIRHVWSLKP